MHLTDTHEARGIIVQAQTHVNTHTRKYSHRERERKRQCAICAPAIAHRIASHRQNVVQTIGRQFECQCECYICCAHGMLQSDVDARATAFCVSCGQFRWMLSAEKFFPFSDEQCLYEQPTVGSCLCLPCWGIGSAEWMCVQQVSDMIHNRVYDR